VIVGREFLKDGRLQAIAVVSKNANVATGARGLEHARSLSRWVGEQLGLPETLVLPSSTGVIGVLQPIKRIEQGCQKIRENLGSDTQALERFARAIMTTDRWPKWFCTRIGPATLVGVAKGAGMIEPNMATMLSYFVTDAELPAERLDPLLRKAVNRSFNRISIDSDTSTSDTVALLANGLAGPVDEAEFAEALNEGCTFLAKEIVRNGEGVTKTIELTVSGADSQEMAVRIGRSILNSPLVKTAFHGGDPNWGRIVMAVGKVFEHPVALDDLEIRFPTASGVLRLNNALVNAGTVDLTSLRTQLQSAEVQLEVSVGNGNHQETFWGCDLSQEFVAGNAFYTT
jgi:glutamate N-acetyltransferase/amino-acid N-acetyltransferase